MRLEERRLRTEAATATAAAKEAAKRVMELEVCGVWCMVCGVWCVVWCERYDLQ